MENDKQRNSSIWVDAFKLLYATKNEFRTRLKELQTWDKPLCPKSDDKYGKWKEWAKKCEALEYLISQ